MSIAFQQPTSTFHRFSGYNTPNASQHYNSHMGPDYNPHLSSSSSVAPTASAYAYSAHPPETVSSEQPPVGYQPNTQEVRPSSTYSSSGTPSSEYGIKPDYNLNSSQRPPSFPQEYNVAPRSFPESRYPPASNASSAGMNQSAPPLPPLGHPMQRRPANPEASEDTSITTASSNPPYPPQHYPPYQQTPEMSQSYSQQPAGAPQQYHPNWPNAAYPAPPFYSHPVSAPPPGGLPPARTPIADKTRRKRNSNEQSPMAPTNSFTFIPIPGATQHKRPRRRYEEIERMYKCGYQGCEKAYGTLNHLNAHVTMQSHGPKRTPEEFKEIRKEWKARKKEEEAQRKAEEEQRARQQAEATTNVETPAPPVSSASYPSSIPQRQLPPIGYQAPNVSTVPHYPQQSSGMDTIQPYAPANQIYSGQPYNGSPYNHSQGSQLFTPPRQLPAQASAVEADADAEPDPDVPSGTYPQ